MGRKKSISDVDLIQWMDKFFQTECNGCEEQCTIPKFTDFLVRNGISIQAYVLRRNPLVKQRFAEMKEAMRNDDIAMLISYKTLDAKAFVESNRGDKAMILALTQLDDKTKTLCDSALKYIKEGKKYIQKIGELEQELLLMKNDLKCAENTIKKSKQEIDTLKSQITIYKRYIDTYVLPEIANELLAKMGELVNTPRLVDKTATEETLFNGAKKINERSKVIDGLFSRLEE